jgi:hypothetical protein
MEAKERASGRSANVTHPEYAAARSLLAQRPVALAHVLLASDEFDLGLVWIAWLDQADALSQYAGNTRIKELLLRTGLFAATGVVVGWLIAGFPRAWTGLGLGVVAWLWWLMRRRAWQRSAALHVLWGALINAEFKRRYQADQTEPAKALLEKVEQNVTRFVKNWEAWVGQPVARRIGCRSMKPSKLNAVLTGAIGMLLFVGVLAVAGFGIASTRPMPDHAQVLLDDSKKTYSSPPCVADARGLRWTTAGEAHRLKYRPDNDCCNAGGFVSDGRSLTGLLLQKLGVLPPLRSRWNADGSWNW